ncbi:MAG TPA: SRPBCC family protein [Candidatus Sulfotelmatobacter sp.]|nr:SRPBCC family protein [Candidatus Sulfotelmatobacter sp.]
MVRMENDSWPGVSTRRQVFTGIGVGVCGLLAGLRVFGQPAMQAMEKIPSAAANQKRTSIHEEIDLKATPKRIYELLVDSKGFAALTGAPAMIDSSPGGAFSMFGGLIVGRNIEMIPDQRVVQAWRPTHWDAGVYSIVKFELRPNGPSTTVVLDHTGFPEGEFDHLEFGWHSHYWEPLTKYFA